MHFWITYVTVTVSGTSTKHILGTVGPVKYTCTKKSGLFGFFLFFFSSKLSRNSIFFHSKPQNLLLLTDYGRDRWIYRKFLLSSYLDHSKFRNAEIRSSENFINSRNCGKFLHRLSFTTLNLLQIEFDEQHKLINFAVFTFFSSSLGIVGAILLSKSNKSLNLIRKLEIKKSIHFLTFFVTSFLRILIIIYFSLQILLIEKIKWFWWSLK